VTVVRC